jgi:hypothetical protein
MKLQLGLVTIYFPSLVIEPLRPSDDLSAKVRYQEVGK